MHHQFQRRSEHEQRFVINVSVLAMLVVFHGNTTFHSIQHEYQFFSWKYPLAMYEFQVNQVRHTYLTALVLRLRDLLAFFF